MPQLELATYSSQIFWLAITFAILYFYLAKGPLPVIRQVLHNRQQRIESDLKKAESLKEEAKAAAEDFTFVILEARQKASEMLHAVTAKVVAEEAARNAKIESNFAHQNKEAEQRVAILRKEANVKLLPVIAGAAVLMTKKLIGVEIDQAHAERIALQLATGDL